MILNYKHLITKENINKFTKNYVEEITFYDDYAYVKFFRESMGPSPEFHIDDYTFKGINYTSHYDLSENWRKFILKQLSTEEKKKYVETYNQSLDDLKIGENNLT